MTDNTALRATFNQSARDYDAVRPGYPEQLIEDIVALSAIPASGRILEIGCGTGQATQLFARRGYAIRCLDIGADLVAIARENFQPYPNVDFEVAAFEDWEAQDAEFDLVMAATAWHWVPPEIGYLKAARILRPAGAIAIFANHHPKPYTGFFEANQPIYSSIVPEWEQPDTRPAPDERGQTTAAWLERTGLFGQIVERRYSWSKDYTREEYIQLLNTYSDHLSLEPERRARLYAALGDLIDTKFSGIVTRPYLSTLHLARKTVEKR
jgi:SAM-dependent methyltransferase